jgi:hypothetical protein
VITRDPLSSSLYGRSEISNFCVIVSASRLSSWPMVDKEREENTQKEKFRRIQHAAGWFAGIALFLSLCFAPAGWGKKIECGGVKVFQAIVLGAWILGPPLWFWYEYIFLFRDAYPDAKKENLEEFKYQQDVSSKIWLAAVSVLLILYFWKDIGRP